MGISRNGGKTKENIENDVADPKEGQDKYNNTAGNIGKDPESLGDKDDVDDDDGDDVQTEYIPERECDDRIHRLEWNNGARDDINEETFATSGSIFDTILQMTQEHQDGIDADTTKDEKLLPLWDDLFESKNKKGGAEATGVDAEAGLEDLLDLFGDGATTDSINDDSCSVQSSSEDENQKIDMSLLSQGAQLVANQMVSRFSSRGENTTATLLERSCPNWKENIYFALMQKDPNEIQEALENVRLSRIRMQAQRKRILDAWECKNVALEVFETALKTSAARLKNSDDSCPSPSQQQNGDAGFIATQVHQDEDDDNILTQTEG